MGTKTETVKISLKINGQTVQVAKGTSVLEAARTVGIKIPTLCHLADLTPEGSCRICLVEVEGARGLVTACTYPASEGISVRTLSPAILEARRKVVELILANHPQDCLFCQRNTTCELQALAQQFGVKEVPYAGEQRRYQIDESNPFIIRDSSKCILCGRCVRVCQEVQCCNILDWTERGFNSKIAPAFDEPLVKTDCFFCGTCLSACPTGALVEKPMRDAGMPDKKVKTTCPFCGVGCNYDLNVKDGKVIGVTSNLASVVNGRITCVKGRFGTDYVHSPERLTKPLIKKDGEFVEASWDEALTLVAEKFTEIKKEHGSDSIAAISSARCVNEDNYAMQKFIRAVIGTNNVDHCARTCHAPTVAGLAASFGSGAMTNSIGEVPDCKVIFLIGGNPTEAHPAIGAKMRQALRKGAKLIVADPRKIELAGKADVFMQLRPGTDIALINGMMHIILKAGWHDQQFIAEHTKGFAEVAAIIEKYTPEYVEAITGVPAHLLREAARIYATSQEGAAIFYTLGITEHTCGTDNVMSLANLAMLTGNVGKPNAGVNPMRGQNNVQGSCDMGALPNVYSGYQKVDDPEAQQKFEKAWGVKLSNKVGIMLPDMIDGAVAGTVKAMYVMGEDPVLTDGDANHVRKGFANLDFLVVQNLFMTETGKLADVILPGASFAEKDSSFTNCERRVQRVRKAIEPIGESLADWLIICKLAQKFDYDMAFNSASEIMDEMAALSPMFAGLSFERIDANGLQWPVPSKEHPGTTFLHKDGHFTSGLGNFMAIENQLPGELPDEEYPFVLTTGRILYHYNITTAGHSKHLTEFRPEERVMIHPQDALRLNIQANDEITVTSRRGQVTAKAWVTDAVLPGGIWMSFHFAKSPTNQVTSGFYDKTTKTYEYKVCAVNVSKAAV